MRTRYPSAVFAALATACILAAGQAQEPSQKAVERIQREVRHEL